MPHSQKSVTKAWTLLTDNDITAITFQNLGPYPIYIKATVGANPPTADDLSGSLVYETGGGETAKAIADLFPGIAGRNRLYAASRTTAPSRVTVSHA
jgi:hypothetical protein